MVGLMKAVILALGALVASLCCGCSTINSVSCTLGTPLVSGTKVEIPYTLAEHKGHDEIYVYGTVSIQARNTATSAVTVYTEYSPTR
jgi:hypothetical protein